MKHTALIVAGLLFGLIACAENKKQPEMQGTDESTSRTDGAYTPPDAAGDPGMQPNNLYTTTVTPPPRGTGAAGGTTGGTAGGTAYVPVETAGGEELAPSSGARRPAAKSSGSTARSRTRYYVVKKGDTLSEISEKVYGDADKWRRIYNANRSKVKDPKKLQVGTRLTIP